LRFETFLDQMRASPSYAGQIVYVREVPARPAVYAPDDAAAALLSDPVRRMLQARGITRLYTHQAEALRLLGEGKDPVVVTGTASGKSLCYVAPILEMLLGDPAAKALLLFPTKALCQDQFQRFQQAMKDCGLGGVNCGLGIADCGLERTSGAAGVKSESDGNTKRSSGGPSSGKGAGSRVLAGVYDGDTPSTLRRRLRDHASVVFTNPDMLHAALMPQHARWAEFLSNLRFLVIDELHVYSGIFGSNAANLFRRFFRLCGHYGSHPRMVACSATIANPEELAERVTGRRMTLVDSDGSPRGKRTYVFWNPPRFRPGDWRSRRSANVEAHELMSQLVARGVPTITFSKARVTAEMIHRYVCEKLREIAPHLAAKVTPYRGGYLPEERREIERRLFNGELLGVSTTPALELGIDIGGMDASILVGYPGTLASFFQQTGRSGRRDREALAILIGLDTTVNQYILTSPDYLFGRPMERGVVDADNPFVVMGHLRCATHELPLPAAEAERFGPHAEMALRILQENKKVRRVGDSWFHTAPETPQHEISLRDTSGANVVIQDVDTGEALGEVDRLDAPPLVHPEAIYLHRGDTFRVLELDLEKNVARVKREEVDYYTQPWGGTDVHHVDHRLREKAFGTGRAYWGEVTAYFHTYMFEKIHFYELDAISRHGLDLPTFSLETMAFWIVPPEDLMEAVRQAGLDAHQGLRGIGYAARMLLPLFMTCDTLDFSHSVGAINSPWNAVFIYERYPHGLGFTAKAYDLLHELMPAALKTIRDCGCEDGCPCCVGKPLRQFTTWNVERGEASVPSKAAARLILEGLMGDGSRLREPDAEALSDGEAGGAERLERALRRRLEVMREPRVFHPIAPVVPTEYPEPAPAETLAEADSGMRRREKVTFAKELRKRLAKKIETDDLHPMKGVPAPPEGMRVPGSSKPPTFFPGRPIIPEERVVEERRGAGRELDATEKREAEENAATGPEPAPGPKREESGAGMVPDLPKAEPAGVPGPIRLGDSLAARARRIKKGKT
jgi:DEAD/DEAH box helicase domain-containing protein